MDDLCKWHSSQSHVETSKWILEGLSLGLALLRFALWLIKRRYIHAACVLRHLLIVVPTSDDEVSHTFVSSLLPLPRADSVTTATASSWRCV